MPPPTMDLDPATPEDAGNILAEMAKSTGKAQEPITSSSADPLISGEVYPLDWLANPLFSHVLTLSLLVRVATSWACSHSTLNPSSQLASSASAAPEPHAALPQLQRLKLLLSSPIETLVEDPEEVKSVLEEIRHQIPVSLQVKLWPAANSVLLQTTGAVSPSKDRVTPRPTPVESRYRRKMPSAQ